MSSRTNLSIEKIVGTAAELLASEGAEGISMRRLAQQLGVTPMALYRWFPNKDALVDALAEHLLADAVVVPTEGTWVERTTAYATAIRAKLLAHRALLRVAGASRRLTAGLVHSADDGLGLMIEIGYRQADAVEAFRVLLWTVLDFCLVVDATDALAGTSASDGAVRRVANEDGEAFSIRAPHLASLIEHVTTPDPDRFFAVTVRTVAHGLLAMSPNGGFGEPPGQQTTLP